MARTNEWLTEVGAWIFGGLLALNLVLIASLLDVGPVDTAILISICALGCAFSVNVVGIVLNRLVKDIKYVQLAERLPILQELGEAESPRSKPSTRPLRNGCPSSREDRPWRSGRRWVWRR